MRQYITVNNDKEGKLLEDLAQKTDIQSERIKRLLALPDLTKKDRSPINILVNQIKKLPRFADFDVLDFPKIVSVQENFDLLNTPQDHPSRRQTDTYYLTDNDVLRTQTTVMWPYYIRHEGTMEKLQAQGYIGLLSTGIVFRKDEIDRKHFPAFHQIDGLYICKKSERVIVQKDLEDVLVDIAQSIFGKEVEYKFAVDSFPFTDPSVEMNLKLKGQWMEVLGSGLVHTKVLRNLNIDPEVYNGWAFGFGLERLAMVKMGINDIRIFWSEDPRITSQFKDINSKYKEVSKYPPISRDISFIISKSVNLNNYYELVRDQAGDLVEEVQLMDQYENDEKFGTGKKSYTFHIVYRSLEKTLTDAEVNAIHDKITEKTKEEFGAVIR